MGRCQNARCVFGALGKSAGTTDGKNRRLQAHEENTFESLKVQVFSRHTAKQQLANDLEDEGPKNYYSETFHPQRGKPVQTPRYSSSSVEMNRPQIPDETRRQSVAQLEKHVSQTAIAD